MDTEDERPEIHSILLACGDYDCKYFIKGNCYLKYILIDEYGKCQNKEKK